MANEDGPIGATYEQVVHDIWEAVPNRDRSNFMAYTNRVLRKFLNDPRLCDVLLEAARIVQTGWAYPNPADEVEEFGESPWQLDPIDNSNREGIKETVDRTEDGTWVYEPWVPVFVFGGRETPE